MGTTSGDDIESFLRRNTPAIMALLFVLGSRVPIKADPGIAKFYKSKVGTYVYYVSFAYVFTRNLVVSIVIAVLAVSVLPAMIDEKEPEIPDAAKKAAKVAAKAVVRVIDEAGKTAVADDDKVENFAGNLVYRLKKSSWEVSAPPMSRDKLRLESLPESDPRVGFRRASCKSDGTDDYGSRPGCYNEYPPAKTRKMCGADGIPLGLAGDYMLAAELVNVPGHPGKLLTV